MGRSGHNLYLPPPSCFLHCLEVARLCNLFITQIRNKDPFIVFQKINGRHLTSHVKRKWRSRKPTKNKCSFTTEGFLKWYKDKQKQGGTFCEELKKAFTWLHFGKSKQKMF